MDFLIKDVPVTISNIESSLGLETVVGIPEGFKYLNEVFTTFPDNSFLCKSVAGVGGTSLAITNKENYVIAGSSVELVVNKSDQHDNLIPVFSGIYPNDIVKQIEINKCLGIPIKIITTYDSLPKVVEALGDDVKEYKILVDELQVLLKASDKFKPAVVSKVLSQVDLFKSVCFMTATPTPRKYFPPEVAKLDYYKLVWGDSEKMVVKKAKVKGDITTKITAIALNHLDNGGTPLFFYNSLRGIIPCVKNLIKARRLTHKDIKIICANTDTNISYLKEQLGKEWLPEKPLYKEVGKDGVTYMNPRNKKIIFVTKYAFEGLDFNVEDAHTYVVSDVRNKHRHHTRIDISTDLQQVAGRCRNQDPMIKRECVFLWNDTVDGAELSEEEYEDYVRSELALAKDLEDKYSIERLRSLNINFDSSPYFVEIDGNIVTNEYAIYGMCISYASLNVDYVNVMVDGNKTTRMEEKLDLFSETEGFTLPTLSLKDKNKLARKQNFKELSQEYYEVYKELSSCTDEKTKNNLENELKMLRGLDPEFREILKVIDIEEIKSTFFHKTKSKVKYKKALGIKDVTVNKSTAFKMLSIKEGCFYPYSEIKENIQHCYDKLSINATAKATDIKTVFNVKRTKRNGVEGFLIGGKL